MSAIRVGDFVEVTIPRVGMVKQIPTILTPYYLVDFGDGVETTELIRATSIDCHYAKEQYPDVLSVMRTIVAYKKDKQ